MTIKSVTYTELKLALTQPYVIAYETVTSVHNFILKIETSTGLTAWGCGAPDVYVTNETIEQFKDNLEQIIIPFLIGKDPFTYQHILQTLSLKLGEHKASLAIVDIALMDLLARQAQLPLYKLLGGYRDSIPTSITIGILPLDEMLAEAANFFAIGFNIFKIKGGLNLEEDIEKIIKLRAKYGKEIDIRFDGNQGYTSDQAIRFVNETLQANVEILEQPTLFGRDDLMGIVTNAVDVPVMADESIKGLKDTYFLAKNDLINMVNIKIQKVGGINNAAHINSVSKAAKMPVMVGCLDECGMGISAGLHFALSRPNIKYADLDGHLDIVDDPFGNMLILKDGCLYPNDAIGLGTVDF